MSKESSISGDNLLTALLSGTTAAAISSTLTYPLDCIKTQQQLNDVGRMHKFNMPGNYPSTIAQLFKGGSALVIGTVMKNSARLVLYNWLTKFMTLDGSDGHKKISAPRIVIAGVMSGFLETLWIIPFENIKITMIQNMTLHNEILRAAEHGIKYDVTGTTVLNKHHKPITNVFSKQYISPHAYFTADILSHYKGHNKPTSRFQVASKHHNTKDILKAKYNKHPTMTFLGTIREIYSLKGLRGFLSGTCITMVRQVAISTVWLSTYNATRQLLDPHSNSNEQSWFGHKHTAFQLVGLHLLSSIAVVAATEPLDVVKSHLQLKNGKLVYKDSLSTAYRLFMEQGYRSLWKGALPRGIKIAVNGGLTASIYTYVDQLAGVAGGQTVFAE
mmetsp:Transcript_6972/g.8842  ORF Transcript_6972/g.8842 Transcript_6972/m.8842 type:complete len:387 (+) Transcript_6972:31-1191(+)